MPRRQFQADLKEAVGLQVAGISDVQPGADDGEFTFSCIAHDGQQLQISVLVTDVSDYPSSHTCMIFAGDSASASVAAALADITDVVGGKTISQILQLVSSKLQSTDDDGDSQMVDSQAFSYLDEDDDASEEEEDYFPDDEDALSKPRMAYNSVTALADGFTEATSAFQNRIRSDLSIAKSEGFKVGYLGGLMQGLSCYVSLAIRISKLGISEEAMSAWQVEPSEYLVVIFHYPAGYKSMDDLRSYDAQQARRCFGIRTGICTTYKPTMQEAVTAFSVLNKEHENQRQDFHQDGSQSTLSAKPRGFRNSFISRPLNELCDQRFPMLVQYRYGGMSWLGAERFFNDTLLTPSFQNHDATHAMYYEDEHVGNTWPKVVTTDHITSVVGQQHSLPLVGMQFVLRHFVRCTEFCLVCFNKTSDDLQAIKPYVCDNPLCLYQYMSLGFGPSIEHEILSQPKVVDLLVSFCYASARAGRLKDFPTGLSLTVPPPIANSRTEFTCAPGFFVDRSDSSSRRPPASSPRPEPLRMRYNEVKLEMLFENSKTTCPVAPGTWIVIRVDDDNRGVLHCRVTDVSLYPSVKLSEPVVSVPEGASLNPHQAYSVQSHPQKKETPKPRYKSDRFRSASFYIYNNNIDDLNVHEKQLTIATLLEQLPTVQEMRAYLQRKSQSTLSSWVDRLSPAALGILRWIIASNRACILQVDENAQGGHKVGERVCGMSGWAQFRFAMGAPDKERRFIEAVRDTTARLGLHQYPTLFAWHGSPLQNWHGIIREGLHFKETHHGRAYGNGVYHSLNIHTSLGYSGHFAASWPMSELNIQQALALNEIVNVPREYVSQAPHLVVAQLDWIQTRYLFVKKQTELTGTKPTTSSSMKVPTDCVKQDPARTPVGVDGSLSIPLRAIATSRRTKTMRNELTSRLRGFGNSQYDPIDIEDDSNDTESVATLNEDLEIFEDHDTFDDELRSQQHSMDSIPTPKSVMDDKGKSKLSAISEFSSRIFSKSSRSQKSLTDYVPGTLDYSTLPMLQVPAWATTSATKRLMKDFKDMVSTQNKQPLHELGWHIDEDKIENMYQWIVEMHSFDADLPLAQDMKKRSIKSIVLELRFGKDHPMSPPFVRVIRPRFLSFAQGGGGHVTAGGAMCMELLTNDGWNAVLTIESVLLQVRMAITSKDPRPARLAYGGPTDYSVWEAVEAYTRACAYHGWTVPAGFKEMALGGHPGSMAPI